jgi:hypothetical protein
MRFSFKLIGITFVLLSPMFHASFAAFDLVVDLVVLGETGVHPSSPPP